MHIEFLNQQVTATIHMLINEIGVVKILPLDNKGESK